MTKAKAEPTTSIPSGRYKELLEKEQAADAALKATRALTSQYARLGKSTDFWAGYRQAIKDYNEAIMAFVAANPLVVADATAKDDLPF